MDILKVVRVFFRGSDGMTRFKWDNPMLKGSGHDKPGPGSRIRSFHENYNCLKNTLAVGEYLMGCLICFFGKR